MKQIATLVLLLCASVCWGQTCAPDFFGSCSDSPFSSAHAIVNADIMPMMPTPLNEWSEWTQPLCGIPCYPPLWLTTKHGWTRPFTLDSFEIEPKDVGSANGYFEISSYCGTPWTPPVPEIDCKMVVSWSPTHEGLSSARAYFKAHFLDDGSDATHTVLLVGIGLPARHR